MYYFYLRCWGCLNAFVQIVHLKGLSSECMRRCWRKLYLELKVLSQLGHWKGLSPVCVRSWIYFKTIKIKFSVTSFWWIPLLTVLAAEVVNWAEQWWHWKDGLGGGPWVCVIMWRILAVFLKNDLSQKWHWWTVPGCSASLCCLSSFMLGNFCWQSEQGRAGFSPVCVHLWT